MSLTLAVQKAVVDALNGALSAGVYTRAPAGAALPYVVVGPVTAVPHATQVQRSADELRVHLTVWSAERGNVEVEQILEAVRVALDHARLPLEAGEMTAAYLIRRSSEPDIDSETFIGRATLRVLATR